MIQRLIIVVIAAGFAAFGAALASDDKPLTEDQAKRFVKTLPALEALRDDLDGDGKIDELSIETQPKAGEPFKPYSKAVAALKEKYPADHARLASAVRPHGFSTDEWGRVGDRVIVAYLALKMAEEDPRSMAMMDGMDQSMLDMLPPEMKEQVAASFALLETVRNAPEADKKAVATVKDALDEHMDEAARS